MKEKYIKNLNQDPMHKNMDIEEVKKRITEEYEAKAEELFNEGLENHIFYIIFKHMFNLI